ncbi:MAG: hypothetical protein IJY72_03920, partial [Akkermansia sp.]|nr:hypothetical protein [Akkermansia sp.]
KLSAALAGAKALKKPATTKIKDVNFMRFLNHFHHKAKQRYLPCIIHTGYNSAEGVATGKSLLHYSRLNLPGSIMHQFLLHI